MSENTIQATVGTEIVEGQEILEGTVEVETTEALIEGLVEAAGTDDFSAYGVWKVLVAAIEAFEIDKKVPSQMMYNYSKNGLIAKGKKGDMKARYNAEEVQAFVTKYVKKHAAK